MLGDVSNGYFEQKSGDPRRSCMARELLEISDLIVDFDPHTLERKPVEKQQVIDKLRTVGDRSAARIVERMPAVGGVLDVNYVDQLLVRVHCEMQRLSEEFQHGRRVQELLKSIVQALTAGGIHPPFPIVDIGCGTGYVVRWLAAHGGVDGAELVGVDFNGALIAEANRLAQAERLNCRFEVANAFCMSPPATVYLSTGVIHHFRGDEALENFFAQHDHPATMCFAHMDFQPTVLARPGAWLFHYVRMREPLAHHDGIISARRAHTASRLLQAARRHSFLCGTYGTRIGRLPIPRVFHTIIGIRPNFVAGLRCALGQRVARLGEMT